MIPDHSVSSLSPSRTRDNIISQSVSIASATTPSGDLYNISYLLKRIRHQRNSQSRSWSPAHTNGQQSTLHRVIIDSYQPTLNDTITLVDTQRQTMINTPIHRRVQTPLFHLDDLRANEYRLVIDDMNKRLHRRQHASSTKSSRLEKQRFNNATYCLAYCTIIVIGKLAYILNKFHPIISSRKSTGVTIGGCLGGLFEFITSGLNGCNNEQRGHIKCQIKYASLHVMTRCINTFYSNVTLKNAPFICLCRFRNDSRRKYRDCEFLHAKIQYI